jgi:ABC-type glycerol-3-phosphate transport system substrate-binding protein
VLKRTKSNHRLRAALSALLLIVAGVALVGCGPGVAVVQSKKSDDYGSKLQRVLVARNLTSALMTATHKNALMTLDEMRQAFNAKITGPGVSLDYVDLENAANKVETLTNAISASHPAQVLELKTSAYETKSYVLGGYTIDATVFDVALKKIVWRTQVVLKSFPSGRLRNGPFGARKSLQDDADDVADTLAAKLKADGLL